MSNGRFVQEYRKSAVNGASPLQLVVMLYDGALKFMEAGKHAMAGGDLEKQNQNLQKAQRIISELMSCLDMEKGGEIAKNLFALYSFALNQLVEANITDDPKPIDTCIKVLSDLRESWVALENDLKAQKPGDQRLAA